jgi:hypothetical protein
VKRAAFLGLSALLLAACEDAPAPAPATSAKPVAATSAAPKLNITPPVVAEITVDDLPTIEDFEDEANKDITAANLEKELDALEKEINAAP